MQIITDPGPLPQSGCLVVPVGHDRALSAAASELDALGKGIVKRALEAAGDLRHGQVVDLFVPATLPHDRLLLLVLGGKDGGDRLELERAGGAVARSLRALKVREAWLAATDGLDLGLPPADTAAALALGAGLRAYRFARYRKTSGEDEPLDLPERLRVSVKGGEADLAGVPAIIEAVRRTRDLVSEPANVKTPRMMVDACLELAAHGVEVEVLDAEQMGALGMRALLGVAQGSARPPFTVVMRWRGGGGAAPLALVGKGVCFDSGGISIKPAAGMEDMKHDMAGAAAVLGTLLALALRQAKADVVGVVGLVENMPSGTAQRPGDVVRSMAGKTIEVINTDAEGRLVLADLLHYTVDRFKPKAVIDLATLTGAVVVALGHERAGLFASDNALATGLIDAGEATGELVWRLPLGKAYEKHVRSEVADLKNVGRGREAGSIAGAVFLQQFVGDVPWAHLDIAGTAWTSRDLPLAGKGATAFGVRLLDRFVADRFERAEA